MGVSYFQFGLLHQQPWAIRVSMPQSKGCPKPLLRYEVQPVLLSLESFPPCFAEEIRSVCSSCCNYHKGNLLWAELYHVWNTICISQSSKSSLPHDVPYNNRRTLLHERAIRGFSLVECVLAVPVTLQLAFCLTDHEGCRSTRHWAGFPDLTQSRMKRYSAHRRGEFRLSGVRFV